MRSFLRLLSRPPVITATMMTAVVVVPLVSGALLQKQAERALHHEVRQNLVRLARVAALHVDGDRHLQWKPGDETTPEYQRAIAPFRRIIQVVPEIDDIYTCVLENGKVHFVLDAMEPGDADGDGVEDKAYIGEVYEGATPEMLQALRDGVAIAENRFYTDRWGTYISGYAPIRNPSGQVVGIVGVDLHVDRYQQHMAAIRRSARFVYGVVLLIDVLIGTVVWKLSRRAWHIHEQLRLHARAMEMAANAIVITDRNGTIQWVNPAFTRMTGYSREEAIGQNPRILKSGKHDRAFYEQMWQTILAGRVWKGELVNRRKDGRLYTEEMTIAPVWDKRGDITHFIAIKQDVTERKQAQEQLEQALQQAQAASRAKSEFLANMSHETRTPMNGILGMAQLLMDTPLNEEQKDYVSTLKSSAESLLSLLGDILDISRIEEGKMSLYYAPFDLRQMVHQVAQLFAARAREKGLRLHTDIADGVPSQVLGDELRLRQILSNFVGNAVKFTEQGEVTIRVRLDEPGDEQRERTIRQQFNIAETHSTAWLRLEVADTGIGIPADKQAIIFESFAQADGSTTRQYGGSGLGLAINRRLTELMGGTIGVQSVEGKGSMFWVTLPLFVPDMEQSLGTTSHDAEQKASGSRDVRLAKRVLLVEDNEVNRRVAVRLLERLGCEVDVAQDGVEAVEKTAERRYDAVLMDLHMPRMDGLEATRRIRERERFTGEHQVIIAMTASAMKEDVHQCLMVGMDDYLSKPVRMEALQAMLERHANAPFAEETAQKPPIDHDFLAEMTGGDEAFAQEILGEFLRTIPPLLEEAEQSLNAGDSALLTRAAHTMKGSARAVGAQQFSEIAFALEQAGRAQNLQEAPEILQALREEWQRVQDYIHQQFLQRAA
ncbi:MAG: response regulator [Chthonomonadetes bacterium]|nr:response regulator [Chthonomonadetes bacterium]